MFLQSIYIFSTNPFRLMLHTRKAFELRGCSDIEHVSRSYVKVIAEVYKKSMSGAYRFSLLFNLANTSLTECLRSKGVH